MVDVCLHVYAFHHLVCTRELAHVHLHLHGVTISFQACYAWFVELDLMLSLLGMVLGVSLLSLSTVCSHAHCASISTELPTVLFRLA